MSELRLFTREEAERTLPLVRRIVEDLLAEYPRWHAALGRFELLSAGARAEWEAGETPEAAQAEVARHAERIDGFIAELRAIGCELRLREVGHIDFRSLRQDAVVYLCWRPGEARIDHWHPLEGGVAERQPIDAAILSETVT
ncbi:MAG TPA: DUF2203 domain-containing protein [Gemmatimonadales bacterium]|nr:DUF2203 domain-containing protein [Gemmatimonadales bacterium]